MGNSSQNRPLQNWSAGNENGVVMSVGEKLRLIMKRQGVTMGQLAEATGQSRQNLSNKMSRDNFSEREIHAMAAALGCRVSIEFSLPDDTLI